MRKSPNPLIYNGFKAFYMVGVTGFEPMASWSRTKIITKNIVRYLNENR